MHHAAVAKKSLVLIVCTLHTKTLTHATRCETQMKNKKNNKENNNGK